MAAWYFLNYKSAIGFFDLLLKKSFVETQNQANSYYQTIALV